jgi:transposase
MTTRAKKPRATAAEKRPVGRPTKYEPRFCDELEAFMAQGYSATAFAGSIGVSRATIDNWTKEHPEFLEALSRAKAKRLLDWERAAHRVRDKGGGPGTAQIITFGLKNMGGDEWVDKQAVEHTGALGVTYVTPVQPAPAPSEEDYETD